MCGRGGGRGAVLSIGLGEGGPKLHKTRKINRALCINYETFFKIDRIL